ncbi:uncharacterized protein [Diadema antillarum]|uniref:uncharacterized protein n=1 Tax=Diadema antillarum TaxID=105358 RepID=UPI003A8390FA
MRNFAEENGYYVKEGRNGRTIIVRIDDDGNTSVCVIVEKSGQWTVKVHGREVGNDVFPEIPPSFQSGEAFEQFLLTLDSLNICPGNPEYVVPPHLLVNHPVYLHYSSSATTIRHNNCPLLTNESPRCFRCRIHRSSIAKVLRCLQADCSVSPNSAYSCMSQQRLSENLQTSKATACKDAKLEAEIAKMFEEESQSLSMEENTSFSTVFMQATCEVPDQFEEGTRMKILWDQQLTSIQNHPNATRWHPAILRLCIALQAQSPSSHELFRKSGLLALPHQQTLKQYTNFTMDKSGFKLDNLRRIISDIGLSKQEDHKRNIVLSFDEMKVGKGLVYSRSSESIIGFTTLGSLSEEFDRYARMCEGEKRDSPGHVLALMIRALSDSYKATIAHFETSGSTHNQLACIVNSAIEVLELSGFHVRALVSDGAPRSRKFYNMMRKDPADVSFPNRFSGRPIYLLTDAPHLLKACRNDLENSGYHRNNRHMMFRGLDVSWKHIIDAYHWDLQQCTFLRTLHHITEEHIHLTPSHRVDVKLAAQVLSLKMANALKSQGHPETASTALFIRYINTFFDCMNVSQVNSGKRRRNAALRPYTDVSDWRFTWLEEDFLSFLEEWETESQLKWLTDDDKDKFCLSKPTLKELMSTVKAFVQLMRELLSEPGVRCILSEKFSKDPLEDFSEQRDDGDRDDGDGHDGDKHDDPTVSQLGYNPIILKVEEESVVGDGDGHDDPTVSQLGYNPIILEVEEESAVGDGDGHDDPTVSQLGYNPTILKVEEESAVGDGDRHDDPTVSQLGYNPTILKVEEESAVGDGDGHDDPTVSQLGYNPNTLKVEEGSAVESSDQCNVTSGSSLSTSRDSTPPPVKRVCKEEPQSP